MAYLILQSLIDLSLINWKKALTKIVGTIAASKIGVWLHASNGHFNQDYSGCKA